jgi:hypothetical protein
MPHFAERCLLFGAPLPKIFEPLSDLEYPLINC